MYFGALLGGSEAKPSNVASSIASEMYYVVSCYVFHSAIHEAKGFSAANTNGLQMSFAYSWLKGFFSSTQKLCQSKLGIVLPLA